jgi:hypothetical protein
MVTEVIQVALADKGLVADVYQVRKVNAWLPNEAKESEQ